ncbi:MAG: CatB-related O-acetyltransferase [Parachlamydiales bacterium]
MRRGPDPESRFPLENWDKLGFLKHFITAHNIEVGDYTYYDDAEHGPETFERRNILYNFPMTKERLTIGKFCAIAAETRFMMGGHHKLDAVSTYPFPVFGNGWEEAYNILELPQKGDIVVGHDVWFGYNSLVMNGVTIGNGAIVGARSVVVKDVPAYSIVAGSPARVVKMRFEERDIERLERIAWWNWDREKLTRHVQLVSALDIDRLEEML